MGAVMNEFAKLLGYWARMAPTNPVLSCISDSRACFQIESGARVRDPKQRRPARNSRILCESSLGAPFIKENETRSMVKRSFYKRPNLPKTNKTKDNDNKIKQH
jgi:hypothetical protein